MVPALSITFCTSEIPSTKPSARVAHLNEKLSFGAPKAGRKKPLVALIAPNSGAETTDYVIPLSILRRGGGAEVVALSTDSGIVQMMPALKILADQTIAEFDVAHPDGADIVIVPAVHDAKDAVLLRWVKEQHAKDAYIVSICEGARVVANAGLFRGESATTHWYAYDELKTQFADTTWRQDARYLQSHRMISTSGVTASIPVSLALVEAIQGQSAAKNLARQLYVKDYSSRHDGSVFQLNWTYRWLVVRNTLAFWGHEKIGIAINDQVDELALALAADAYSRTYRSQAVTMSNEKQIRTQQGLRIVPDFPLATKIDYQLPANILENIRWL